MQHLLSTAALHFLPRAMVLTSMYKVVLALMTMISGLLYNGRHSPLSKPSPNMSQAHDCLCVTCQARAPVH